MLTQTQVVVAASAPFHAFTTMMVDAFLTGLLEDASRAVGVAAPALPLARGLGGYL